MNIYIYSSCPSMFIVYHPYTRPHFDWWLQFHYVVILFWLLRYRSVVYKFQFEKHDFSWVLLQDIEQGGQKQIGEFLLRPEASKANTSINLSTNLLKFYILPFHLTTKGYLLSISILYFHIQPELVEGGFVSSMCNFVQFCLPMIIRCRIITKQVAKTSWLIQQFF